LVRRLLEVTKILATNMLDLLMQLDMDAGIAITYTAIILMALFPIWVGSFRSLDQTVVKPGKKQIQKT